MGKGNIIGVPNEPTILTAGGVWSLGEHFRAVSETNWPGLIVPMPLGLSPSLLQLQGPNAAWTTHNIDVSDYLLHEVRIVVKYNYNGGTFRNDAQLDDFSLDGFSAGFESGVDNFESSTVGANPDYSSLSWSATPASGTAGQFGRDTGGTPSTGTGLTTANSGSWYLYVEGSGWTDGQNAWVRSPVISLSDTPGNLSFAEARAIDSAALSTFDIYLDVVTQPV